MTTHEAKKIVRSELARLKIDGARMSAKTIGFSDLARADCVFVTLANCTATADTT